MKTKEFIKAVKKLGYTVKKDRDLLYVKDGNETFMLVRQNIRNNIDASRGLNIEDDLFNLLIEYARTPVPEREEEPRYRLRHKWLEKNWEDGDAYLNFNKVRKTCFLSNDLETTSVTPLGTRAKWEQRTGRTWEQLMQEFDAEESK